MIFEFPISRDPPEGGTLQIFHAGKFVSCVSNF